MSRVFAKPVYEGTSISKLLACCDDSDVWHSRMALSGAIGVNIDELLRIKRAAGEGDIARHMEQMHLIGERLGLSKLQALRSTGSKVVLPFLKDARVVCHGIEAQYRILLKYLEGELRPSDTLHHIPSMASKPARESATIGFVASLASPKVAADVFSSLPDYGKALVNFPECMGAYVASEPWRYGVSSSKASEALRDVISNGYTFSPESFLIDGKTFQSAAPGVAGVIYMDISAMRFPNDETVYVMDRDERGQLSELLYSYGMFAMYGMVWRSASGGPDGIREVQETVAYIRSSIRLRLDKDLRVDTFAKQIKASYSVMIAKYGDSKMDHVEKELLSKQISELEAEVTKVCEGEVPWFRYISHWDQDKQIDMGTAWNLLPAPQVVPELLSETMKRKTNAPRTGNREAKEDFLKYCSTVVTAHVLVEIGSDSVEWLNVPVIDGSPIEMEEEDWVKDCRKGNLSYPTSFTGVRIKGVLPWRDHISNWHFTSKDVTHVLADAESYSTRENYEALKDIDNNELLYSLSYGSILSKKYTAKEVREKFLEGRFLGDRIELIAGKSENTKVAYPLEGSMDSGTRETASGDDVAREGFTEIDRNFGLMGRILHGISSRSGRSGLERLISGILNNKGVIGCLLSLDVVGWSPKMWRELETELMDLLISFYKVPETLKASTLLKEVKVVMSKSGYHDVWDMNEGSIQGFFPTGDTIMHSLVAQWAMYKSKKAGKIPKKAEMAKATLIDDILMALSNTGPDPWGALMAICEEYRSLGFEPDVVKTLVSKVKGHFLNRLYCDGKEVLTPSKIFSKADRDHERKLSTIHDRVGAVFGSMWGALDRGADPVWSYYVAHWRSLCLLMQAAGDKWEANTSYTTVSCWLSPSLGGIGIPTYAHWAARDSTTSMSSGIGAISTLQRTLRNHDSRISQYLRDVLYSISCAKVEKKSYVAYMDDPFSVTIEGVVNPAMPALQVMKKAQSLAVKEPGLLRMLQGVDSREYEEAAKAFVQSASYPAPVVAEFATSLPHSTIRSLTIKAERNESLLKLVPFKERKAALNKIHRLNKVFVRTMGTAIPVLACPPEVIPDSSYVLSELDCSLQRVMQTSLAMSVRPPICDIIARQDDPDASQVKLHIPNAAPNEYFVGIKGGGIERSRKSKALVLFKHQDDDSWDPLSRSYATAMNAMCMLSVLGYNAEVASAFFGQTLARPSLFLLLDSLSSMNSLGSL